MAGVSSGAGSAFDPTSGGVIAEETRLALCRRARARTSPSATTPTVASTSGSRRPRRVPGATRRPRPPTSALGRTLSSSNSLSSPLRAQAGELLTSFTRSSNRGTSDSCPVGASGPMDSVLQLKNAGSRWSWRRRRAANRPLHGQRRVRARQADPPRARRPARGQPADRPKHDQRVGSPRVPGGRARHRAT
jgi:hypothetical protein